MKPTKALQETLYAGMLGRIQPDPISACRHESASTYNAREEGKQYPYRCRRKGSMEGAEEDDA